MLESLLLKLIVMQEAEYNTEKVFGKTKEEWEKEVSELSAEEQADILENNGTSVHSEYEDGGRWSNYETKVYRFWHNSESVYYQISKEIPATEIQDGGDFGDPEITQVYPKEVTTTIYVSTPPDETEKKPKGGRK
ncbi:hypothetical protein COM06_19945 [Bacillus toyonensis]|uniref:hypothetical protein n=1 Tax=Bacillus toyonensis TaxID=155322 RepID=UPI000BFA3E81|nr:hypothetical protein [Bacillus toyonensis]MBH0358973.1 hypothetical protein [Bacillus toyonensis biovar Thuringiensis]PGB24774.1 hypothetical protein COM06_19945 [Bacillus toyonensis]